MDTVPDSCIGTVTLMILASLAMGFFWGFISGKMFYRVYYRSMRFSHLLAEEIEEQTR